MLFLHKINQRPADGKKKRSNPVKCAKSNQQTQKTEKAVDIIHIVTEQKMGPFETDKRKGKFGIDKGFPDPAGGNRAPAVNHHQQSEKDTPDDDLRIVNPLK